jgi:hypothetical protein
VLGKWLEFSVHAPDIAESLAFYKGLGFTELAIGDIWPHRYAVVSDGDLSIGLHERVFDSPALTFVQPDLARHARAMADSGYELSFMRIDEDVFNEIGFTDRDGHMVTLIEARTFSRAPEPPEDSLCGRWFELSLPVRDATQAGFFWAPLAPAVLDIREEPTLHIRFEASGLPLALSESIALDRPALCFKCPDRDAIETAIEAQNIRHQAFPGYEGAFLVLQAPEGTRLYLFDEDFLGEGIEVSEGDGASA